jgi:hypothetical protein
MSPMDALNQIYLWKARFGAKPLPFKDGIPASIPAALVGPAAKTRQNGEAPAPRKPSPEAEPSLFD